ncbi:hypothetical protein [Bacillus sp. REN16]|uniref:hypothetical protein n=1 Tax=Bacillus sp. REN16 TaxID=2887296 RepID=UPI001E629BCF|nr:hypothetical protein [Bacillus sp. REN16]MCC3356053.1 hypothetical protein [Bacillus sp. REN16]
MSKELLFWLFWLFASTLFCFFYLPFGYTITAFLAGIAMCCKALIKQSIVENEKQRG